MGKHRHVHKREIAITRKGRGESIWGDIYHRLLRLTWPRFILLFLAMFIGSNAFFACLYLSFPGSIEHIPPGDFIANFAFSVQTISTIGYGYFYPVSTIGHALVTIELAYGMFFTAVLTGLLFAKFSRPSARVVFSENVLWAKQNGQPALVMRMGNSRTNRVYEGRATMTLLRSEVTTEGERLTRLLDLKLMRSKTPLFALSWTIYHLIDESSPFFGRTIEEIRSLGWELMVTFTGLDQDMAQSIIAHTVYPPNTIVLARKFVDMIEVVDRIRVIDFAKLHDFETDSV